MRRVVVSMPILTYSHFLMLFQKMTKRKFIGYSILMFLLFGCVRVEDPKPVKVEEKAKCTNGSVVNKVLIVGIDGVRTDAFLATHSLAFDSLMAHAYVNLHSDCGAYTMSGPGWSTILHGVFPIKNGVVNNDLRYNDFSKYPDMFHYMRRFNPYFNLAAITRWEPILLITSNTNYQQNVAFDSLVKEKALALLNSSCVPDVLFLHFENVDSTGHASGFSPTNPAYIDAIRGVGNHTAQIMSAIEQREQNFGEQWLVFVVTDHGGFGLEHGGQYAISDTRFVFEIARIPNQSRVDVSGDNTNIMPTILKYMGVPIDSTWGLDGVPIF